MQSRLRFLPSFLATILFASVVAQAASCTLDQSGTKTDTTVRTPCNEDANCKVEGVDDKDSCTLNICGPSNVCEFPVVPGIAPEQKAGDCTRIVCTETGDKSDEVDDNDLPDDLESCTVDSCSNGTPVHEKRPDDTACTRGDAAGLCKDGVCTIECGPSFPACNDGNACTEDTCNANTGACSFAALDGLPTPDVMIVQGDCKQEICINGKSTAIADDADLPNDGDSCTTGTCVGGVPSQMATSAGAPCTGPNGPGYCDEMGKKCVECSAAIQCPLPMGPCQERACVNNLCVVNDLAGKEIPSTDGDCKKTVCDAAGMPIEQMDNTDVPVDGNPCKDDVCTNGVPSNPNTMMGASCGGTLTCNGMGQCIGCTTEADCGVSDKCKTYTCMVNGQCSISYVAAGMALPKGDQTAGDCKVLQCDGMGNTLSNVDTNDIPVDLKECTVDSCDPMGNPANTPKALNDMCGSNGDSVCDGLGNCLKKGGTTCAAANECLTGYCTDNVCCDGTCTNQCMACNLTGTAGTCTNLPAGSDDMPLCVGTNSCDGLGSCKRDNGQPCGIAGDCSSGFCADGVCCNTACGDTCKSCNLTGTVGTCTSVPNDVVDPTGPMPCNNPYRCDGSGACKGLNGVTCAQGTECLSNYCVDGYCCNNICNQLCKGCANALTGGTSGICSNISNGTDPGNECPNGDCNGSGICSGGVGPSPNGASCNNAMQCASGFCVDGVCCDTQCNTTCSACSAAKKGQGADGTCGNIKYDTDPDNECVSGGCTGMGTCAFYNGLACMTGSQCLSTYCVDGFCCNNVCNLPCYSCSAMLGTLADGQCSFTKGGTDPDNECNGLNPNCTGLGLCSP